MPCGGGTREKNMTNQDDGVLFAQSPESDAGMRLAMEEAQRTLPIFWREVHWENHRIIPFLDMAILKVSFSDDPTLVSATASAGRGDVECMWVTETSFNGVEWSGTLANSPMALTSVQVGERLRFTTERVADWTFSMCDQVMGGFTNQYLRSKMTLAERAALDAEQGLDYGDPANIQFAIEPAPYPTRTVGRFRKKTEQVRGPIPPIAQSADAVLAQEHGMASTLAERFVDDVKQQPELVTIVMDDGFTAAPDGTRRSDTFRGAAARHGADPTLDRAGPHRIRSGEQPRLVLDRCAPRRLSEGTALIRPEAWDYMAHGRTRAERPA